MLIYAYKVQVYFFFRSRGIKNTGRYLLVFYDLCVSDGFSMYSRVLFAGCLFMSHLWMLTVKPVYKL